MGRRWLEIPRQSARRPHRAEVEVEVADPPALWVDIGFLAADDLVDEVAHLGVSDRHPGDGDAGEVALQTLQKRHEIPDRKDMRTHEHAHVVERSHPGIERMREQTGPGGRDAGADDVETGHEGKSNGGRGKASGRRTKVNERTAWISLVGISGTE